MPRVPLLQQQERIQAPTGARFQAQADPRAFGVQEAQQLQQAGRAVEETVRVLDDINTRAKVRNNMNQFRDESRKWMSDFLERKGTDAIDSYQDAETYFDKRRGQYADSLQGRERDMFLASYDDLANQYKNQAIRFQSTSRVQFENATLDAENANLTQEAVVLRYDPSAVKEKETDIINNVLYKNRQQDKAVQQKAVNEARNALYKSVLDAHTEENPEIALEFFKNNKEKFNPSARPGLQKALNEKARNKRAWDKGIELSQSGLTLNDQLAQADKIKDPQESKMVRQYVKERHTTAKVAAEAQYQQFRVGEFQKLQSDPLNYQRPDTLKPEDVTRFDKYKAQAIKDLQAQANLGPGVEIDWGYYAELKAEAETNPKTFARREIEYGRLDKAKLDEVIGLQAKAMGAEPFRTTSVYTQLKDAVAGSKDFQPRIGKKYNPEAAERWSRLSEQFARQMETIPEADRTQQRVGEVINGLLKPVTRAKLLRGPSSAMAFEIPYLESAKVQEDFYLKNPPKALEGINSEDVTFDTALGVYVVDQAVGGNKVATGVDAKGNVVYEDFGASPRRLVYSVDGRLLRNWRDPNNVAR